MKKYLITIISISLAICLIVFGLKGFKYLVTDDTRSYTRIMMHELYNQDENIDYLFVGSSHCYRSVVPSIVDEKLGGHSFNCGSSAQRMDGSLALIKEVLKDNSPKKIVLDIYYEMIDTVPHSEREELTSTYAIADYMPFSMNKIHYLLSASSSDYYINSFVVGRRNWKKLYDFEYIKQLWSKKSQIEYKNYEWVKSEEDEGYYCERGYVAFDGKVPGYENSYDSVHIDTSTFTDEWKEELEEIIRICDDEDIELIVVAAPLPEETLNCIDNYEEYMAYIKNMLAVYSITYLDFNDSSLRIAELDDNCFMDGDHLNTKGAGIYTENLANYLTGSY